MGFQKHFDIRYIRHVLSLFFSMLLTRLKNIWAAAGRGDHPCFQEQFTVHVVLDMVVPAAQTDFGRSGSRRQNAFTHPLGGQ